MKKIWAIAIFATLSIGLFSCSKEKINLVNTSWKYQEGAFTEVIKFTSETEMAIMQNDDGMELTVEGTYQFKNPEVTFNFLGVQATGKVKGNEMTLTDDETNEEKVYTKQ